MVRSTIAIGALAKRAGIAASALRFYEAQGLIKSTRSAGGRRVFSRDVLRRVAFIRVAQSVGLSLEDIRVALSGSSDRLFDQTARKAYIVHRLRLSVVEDVCALQSRRRGTNVRSRATLSPRGRTANYQKEEVTQAGLITIFLAKSTPCLVLSFLG